MAIEAKIEVRKAEAVIGAKKVTAKIVGRKVEANITNNKVEANITTNNVEANVSTNKVEAKVVTHTVVASTVGRQGANGQGVPIGGTARQVLTKLDGTDYNTEWRSNWMDYAANVEYTGTDTIIGSGEVSECTIDGGTVYRFITSAEKANGSSVEDSFYEDFDGINLTNLIVTRG